MTGVVNTGRCDSSILGGRLLASTPRVARTRIDLSVGRKRCGAKTGLRSIKRRVCQWGLQVSGIGLVQL